MVLPRSPARQQQRRRHGLTWLASATGCSKMMLLGILGVAATALLAGHSGPIAQVSRILASTAVLAEAGSSAAGAVIFAGANVTEVVSTAFAGAAVNSMSVANEIWRGIDLFNISMTMREGSLHTHDPVYVMKWLNTSAGKNVIPIPDKLRGLFLDVAGSVCISLPLLSRSDSELHLEGRFYTLGQGTAASARDVRLRMEVDRGSLQRTVVQSSVGYVRIRASAGG